MKNEETINNLIKTGSVTLESLLKASREPVILTLHFKRAIEMATGKKAPVRNPLTLTFKPKKNPEFYGNTLLKEYAHHLDKLRMNRVVQYQGHIFINANIVFQANGKNFDLSRELGLLILRD